MQSESKKEAPNPRLDTLDALVNEYAYVYERIRMKLRNKSEPEALARLTIAIIKHSRIWKS